MRSGHSPDRPDWIVQVMFQCTCHNVCQLQLSAKLWLTLAPASPFRPWGPAGPALPCIKVERVEKQITGMSVFVVVEWTHQQLETHEHECRRLATNRSVQDLAECQHRLSKLSSLLNQVGMLTCFELQGWKFCHAFCTLASAACATQVIIIPMASYLLAIWTRWATSSWWAKFALSKARNQTCHGVEQRPAVLWKRGLARHTSWRSGVHTKQMP